ncbi:MAG: arginine deiminase-related protein [Flavobacteriales bacterium]|nr:arginine deiminase-related protein [Flavobacteriales bacterium]
MPKRIKLFQRKLHPKCYSKMESNPIYHQVTDTILMIRPASFFGNGETAVNNHFQQLAAETNHQRLQREALKEFNDFVELLESAGVRVFVANDRDFPATPDSIFPNNWITFHNNGNAVLYPMFASNRRVERDKGFLSVLIEAGYRWRVFDFTTLEKENKFLEGTGSMVLDRIKSVAYACISDRTHPDAVKFFCKQFGYEPIIFEAQHEKKGTSFPIYHTNVMMSIGSKLAVVCTESIVGKVDRDLVLNKLSDSRREIIEITVDQMNSFAGNMLEVQSTQGKSLMIMSAAAHQSLDKSQINSIEKHTQILSSPLNCIETHGGGSARCMLAEVFLPFPQTDSEQIQE